MTISTLHILRILLWYMEEGPVLSHEGQTEISLNEDVFQYPYVDKYWRVREDAKKDYSLWEDKNSNQEMENLTF